MEVQVVSNKPLTLTPKPAPVEEEEVAPASIEQELPVQFSSKLGARTNNTERVSTAPTKERPKSSGAKQRPTTTNVVGKSNKRGQSRSELLGKDILVEDDKSLDE
jgi:hypothetical protein